MRDSGMVDCKETQALTIIDPHWHWIILEQQTKRSFLSFYLGDVFVRGNPSAVRDRLVYNANDPPIVQVRYLAEDRFLADCGQDVRDILLNVIGTKAAGCSPVFDDFPKRAARPDDIRR